MRSAQGSIEAVVLRGLAALPEPVQRKVGGVPVEIDGQRLAAEVQFFLRLQELARQPAYNELPVDEARALLEEQAFTARGRLATVEHVQELQVQGADGALHARLYAPDAAGDGLLVYYHGGGWVLGSLDSHEATARFLAHETGMRVLSVGYRLAPEHPFPAPPDDATAAFRDAVARARELGVDPERIAVGGDSAGGNLAAVVSLDTVRDDGPRPAAQLLIYPVTDLSTKHDSYRLFGEGFLLTEDNMDWYRDHYLTRAADAANPRVSPLLAEDVSGLPPTYVTLAGFDPLRDEGMAYAEKLTAAGTETRLRVHDGLVHGFANSTGIGRLSRVAMAQAAAWLRAALTR